MATRSNTCEGMPVGVAVSSTNQNSDGTSGDALRVWKTGAATIVGTSTPAEVIFNSRSVKCSAASGENAYLDWSITPTSTTMAARAAFKGFAASANTFVIRINNASGGTEMASVRRLTADGKLTVRNAAGATLYTTPSAAPDPFVADLSMDSGTTTSNGKITFAVYDAAGDLAAGMTAAYENTATNAGAGGFAQFAAFGKQDSGAYALTFEMDAFAASQTYGLLGPPEPLTSSDARPVTLLAASAWEPVTASTIVEALADDLDSTYAQSQVNPTGGVLRVECDGFNATPASVQFHYAIDGAASAPRSLHVALYSGATKIAETTVANITSSTKQTGWLNLSAAENAAWTDRTVPELRFTAT